MDEREAEQAAYHASANRSKASTENYPYAISSPRNHIKILYGPFLQIKRQQE